MLANKIIIIHADLTTHTIGCMTHDWVNHPLLTQLLTYFTQPVATVRTPKLARSQKLRLPQLRLW